MKFRNIGDVLLVSPLVNNLKYHYPNALIDIAVNRGTEEMITLHPAINDVIIYDRSNIKKQNIFKQLLLELQFAFQIRSSKYDMVINTTEGDRGAQLAWLSGASITIGHRPKKNRLLQNTFTHLLPKQGLRHTIETNLDVLRVLNLKIIEKKVNIFWKKDDEDIDLPEEFIHIHPVSRWMFKCISDKTMAQIIDYCELELSQKVVLTAAPIKEELKKVDSILKLCKSEPLNFSGQYTLKQTAALNKKAKAFIGVDTAIMHISAANNIPILAFFGPSGADHWGPWDNDLFESEYLTRRGFRIMGKHRVLQENWECIPCGKDGCDGTKVSDCLMNLDIEFIKYNIKEIIDAKKD